MSWKFIDNTYMFSCNVVSIILDLLIRLNFLYLYYLGLNNLCHYWYSKQWKEFEQFGETERIHEILITLITRTIVSVIGSWMKAVLWNSIGRIEVGINNYKTEFHSFVSVQHRVYNTL